MISPGRFTDDTQMTLFTVEGLIRASARSRSKGICHAPDVVRHAYLRWLHTQGVPWSRAGAEFAHGHPEPDGWLVAQPVLHRRMAPGTTCLSALAAGGRGTVDRPANDSKGCGAVMRAAPVGFFFTSAAETWDAGCEIASITHGHPDGVHPAGVLAVAIRLITALSSRGVLCWLPSTTLATAIRPGPSPAILSGPPTDRGRSRINGSPCSTAQPSSNRSRATPPPNFSTRPSHSDTATPNWWVNDPPDDWWTRYPGW